MPYDPCSQHAQEPAIGLSGKCMHGQGLIKTITKGINMNQQEWHP